MDSNPFLNPQSQSPSTPQSTSKPLSKQHSTNDSYQSKLFKNRVQKSKKHKSASKKEKEQKYQAQQKKGKLAKKVKAEAAAAELAKQSAAMEEATYDLTVMSSVYDPVPYVHHKELFIYTQIGQGFICEAPDDMEMPAYTQNYAEQRAEAIESCFIATGSMSFATCEFIWLHGLNGYQAFDSFHFSVQIYRRYYETCEETRKETGKELTDWQRAHWAGIIEASDQASEAVEDRGFDERKSFVNLWWEEQQKEKPEWDIPSFTKKQLRAFHTAPKGHYNYDQKRFTELDNFVTPRMEVYGDQVEAMQIEKLEMLEKAGTENPELLLDGARKQLVKRQERKERAKVVAALRKVDLNKTIEVKTVKDGKVTSKEVNPVVPSLEEAIERAKRAEEGKKMMKDGTAEEMNVRIGAKRPKEWEGVVVEGDDGEEGGEGGRIGEGEGGEEREKTELEVLEDMQEDHEGMEDPDEDVEMDMSD